MKAFFLFPTFLPTPKPHLILPNHHSGCFSWTHFCQIIVSHTLIKNAVISQVCTGLLFYTNKTEALDFFFFNLKAVGFLFVCLFFCFFNETTCLWSSESSLYSLQYKTCFRISLLGPPDLKFWVPQPHTEVCGLMHAINMLHAVRSQTPNIVLPFS